MIGEGWQCDTCGNKHVIERSPYTGLIQPHLEGWFTLTDGQSIWHFCSAQCVTKQLTEQA